MNQFILELIHVKLSLRTVTQSCVVLIMLIAIWQFYDFYNFVMGNDSSLFPYRPPVGEAFMPLGAVVALIAWIDSVVFDPVHPAGLVILVAAWLTAWIFRRALCSWICPIGTLVQYLGKLGERVMGENVHHVDSAWYVFNFIFGCFFYPVLLV